MGTKRNTPEIEANIAEYLLTYHIGEGDAIISKELERKFGISGAEIRAMISNMRSSGIPICSTSSGYFYPETAEEIKRTAAHLAGRASKMLEAKNGMEEALKSF